MTKAILFAAAAMLTLPAPAFALCSYRGELYAQTTLDQEYHDAPFVVRARVLSASNWQGAEARGTTYRLEVVQYYKGSLPRTFLFSTERNSGGFYLDRGTKPDIGGEYLLFLTYGPRTKMKAARGASAFAINYSCGQSRRWDEVSSQDRTRLADLVRRS
ncbi:hypothetical protein [Erythrobacter donghaensis]|uniref:hypothetical protein n=1 Tax=Erythrobacter donghaensis TaxID=267135 RepID=UPI0012D9CC50|nr:hypothetical protein [Erythrobacter donghaensis]